MTNQLFISKLKIVSQVHNFDDTNMAHRRIKKGSDLTKKEREKLSEILRAIFGRAPTPAPASVMGGK